MHKIRKHYLIFTDAGKPVYSRYGDEITPDLLPPPQRQATPPVTSLRLEATPELHESVPALEMQAGRGASTVSTLGFPVATPETTPRDSAGIKRGAGGAQGKGKEDGVKGGAGQMDYDVVAEHAANALEDRLRVSSYMYMHIYMNIYM